MLISHQNIGFKFANLLVSGHSLPVVVHDGLQSAIHGAGAGVGQVRQVVLPAHVGARLHLKENITYRQQIKKPSIRILT